MLAAHRIHLLREAQEKIKEAAQLIEMGTEGLATEEIVKKHMIAPLISISEGDNNPFEPNCQFLVDALESGLIK